MNEEKYTPDSNQNNQASHKSILNVPVEPLDMISSSVETLQPRPMSQEPYMPESANTYRERPPIYRPRPPKRGPKKGFLSALLILGVFLLGSGLGASIGKSQNQTALVAEVNLATNTLEEKINALESTIQGEPSADNALAVATESTTSSLRDIIAFASPSVVSINTTGTTQNTWFNQVFQTQSAGSGIAFHEDDEKLYIITNYHVIENADEATISFDDTVQIPAHYIGGTKEIDLAVIGVLKTDLLKAEITSVPLAVFADSDKVEMGDLSIAIGNALGQGKSATSGIISATNKTLPTDAGTDVSAIQTDAAINQGNSGGALVDQNGHVIGVNTAKLASTEIEGMGFAIPSNLVKEIATEILQTGKVEKPFIGIDFYPITDQLLEYYNFPSKGIFVNGIYQDSTAHVAGLQSGDIIKGINGKEVFTEADIKAILDTIQVGEQMEFTILRISALQGSDVSEMTVSALVQNASTDPSF